MATLGNEEHHVNEVLPYEEDEVVKSKALDDYSRYHVDMGEDQPEDQSDDQSDGPSRFEARVLFMLGGLQTGMQSMEKRVANLEDKGKHELRSSPGHDVTKVQSACGASTHRVQSTPQRTPAVQSTGRSPSTDQDVSQDTDSGHWADRVDVSMDYSAIPTWDDDEEDDNSEVKGVKLFKVSEKTEKFLSVYFSSAAPNQGRRQLRDKYGAPNITATACPSLDKVIKGRLSAETKSRDKQISKQQALCLDAVGPLTHILEEAAKGELTQKAALEAAQTALKLLGNASAHASRERRKNALRSMNPRLVDMAKDDTIYRSAAPALFGDGFCKKAKERDEELKCLNKATSSSSKAGPTPESKQGNSFFRGPGVPNLSGSPKFYDTGAGQRLASMAELQLAGQCHRYSYS